MTSSERAALIQEFADAPHLLHKALEPFPREALVFKPAPERWSIHEIVWHLADSETNYYVRGKKIIAESGGTIMPFDQDQWAESMRYQDCPLEDALDIIRLLRKVMTATLQCIPETAWSNTMRHPETGLKTLDDWLLIQTGHIRVHLAQMQKNYLLYTQR